MLTNKKNWFYLIIFIVIKLSLQKIELTGTNDSYVNFLITLYQFMVDFMPIFLLVVLTMEKSRHLLKTYIISLAIILLGPVFLDFFLRNMFIDISFVTRVISSIIVDEYLFLSILRKDKTTNVEIKNLEVKNQDVQKA